MTEIRRRYVGSDQPRIVVDRHTEDCAGAQGKGPGAQSAEAPTSSNPTGERPMTDPTTPDLDAIRARLTNANSLALDESVARRYRTDIPALLTEVERLRETNTRLNRRATDAEAQARTTIEDCRRQGQSLGRGLANVGYGIVKREKEAAESRAAALEATLADVRALHTRDRERLAKVEALADLYIAGPMTGITDFNYPAFNEAEQRLNAAGYRTHNPTLGSLAPDGDPPGMTWQDYMRRALGQVVRSGGIALLPGWEQSRGAALEAETARALGMASLPVDEWVARAALATTSEEAER